MGRLVQTRGRTTCQYPSYVTNYDGWKDCLFNLSLFIYCNNIFTNFLYKYVILKFIFIKRPLNHCEGHHRASYKRNGPRSLCITIDLYLLFRFNLILKCHTKLDQAVDSLNIDCSLNKEYIIIYIILSIITNNFNSRRRQTTFRIFFFNIYLYIIFRQINVIIL